MRFCKYCEWRALSYFVTAVRTTLVDKIVSKWIFFKKTVTVEKIDKQDFCSCSLPNCARQAQRDAVAWGEVIKVEGELVDFAGEVTHISNTWYEDKYLKEGN